MWWEGVSGVLKGFKINRGMERSEKNCNWGRVHERVWKIKYQWVESSPWFRAGRDTETRAILFSSWALFLKVKVKVKDELQGIVWFAVYEHFHLSLQMSQVYLSAVWLGWSLGHSVWHSGFILTMRGAILKGVRSGMKAVLAHVSRHHCVASCQSQRGSQECNFSLCGLVVWWGLIALCKLDIVIKGIFFHYKNPWNLRDPNYLKQWELLTSLIPR